MANISLQGSIQGCRVDTGWASKLESDRFLNPQLMICPVWNGFDTAGRRVCPDSFWTKNAGCNSALDRVAVENYQRPEYSSYVTLDMEGLEGNMDPGYDEKSDGYGEVPSLRGINNITGRFGLVSDYRADIRSNCVQYPFAQKYCNGNQDNNPTDDYATRRMVAMQNGYRSYNNRLASGNGY